MLNIYKSMNLETKEIQTKKVESKTCKVGLVLEGGSMRGMFTAGVLDTFMDVGIKVDGIIGVSTVNFRRFMILESKIV